MSARNLTRERSTAYRGLAVRGPVFASLLTEYGHPDPFE
jgi:hypothetical protein